MKVSFYNQSPQLDFRKFYINRRDNKDKHFVFYLSSARDNDTNNAIFCPLCGVLAFKTNADLEAIDVGETTPIEKTVVEYMCRYCEAKYKVV